MVRPQREAELPERISVSEQKLAHRPAARSHSGFLSGLIIKPKVDASDGSSQELQRISKTYQEFLRIIQNKT